MCFQQKRRPITWASFFALREASENLLPICRRSVSKHAECRQTILYVEGSIDSRVHPLWSIPDDFRPVREKTIPHAQTQPLPDVRRYSREFPYSNQTATSICL